MDAALVRQGVATNKVGELYTMKDAMGIMQHHDAVTGTEKQHVAEDYALLLHKGVLECQKIQTAYYEWDKKKQIFNLSENFELITLII